MPPTTPTRRLETVLSRGVGLVGLLAVLPVAHQISVRIYAHLVDQRSIDQMSGVVAAGEGGTSLLPLLLWSVPPLLGIGGCLVLRRLRDRASRRYVAAAVSTGRYDSARSPVLRLTALAWVTLVLGLAGGLAVGLLAPTSTTDAAQREVVELAGSWQGGALGLLGLLLAIGVQAWAFQRRNEIQPLVHRGVLVRAEPVAASPEPGMRGFLLGLRAFLANLWISGLFLLAGWLQATIDGERPPAETMVFDAFVNILAFPTAVVIALAVILWLSPLRWTVRACLSDPTSRVGLGLFVAGALGGIVASEHWLPATAAGVGMLVIAVTMLRLMDLGPQPWLGLAFLLLSWWFGASYDPTDRQNAAPLVPVGVIGWVAAVVTLALLAREVRTHWRRTYATAAVESS